MNAIATASDLALSDVSHDWHDDAQQRHPGVTTAQLRAMVFFVNAMIHGSPGDDPDNAPVEDLIHALTEGPILPGHITLDVSDVPRDWVSETGFGGLFEKGQAHDLLLSRNADEFDTYRTVVILQCEHFSAYVDFTCGPTSDDSADAHAWIDLRFGSAEDRTLAVATWRGKEIDEAASVVHAMLSHFQDADRDAILAKLATLRAKAAAERGQPPEDADSDAAAETAGA